MAPFPGGRVSAGHFIPSGALAPPGPLAPSFSTSPIVLRDNDILYVGSASVRCAVKFESIGAQLLQIISGSIGGEEQVPGLPLQWNETTPVNPPEGVGFWGVRVVEDLGPQPLQETAGSPIGTWLQLNTSRRYSIFRPAAGTVVNTSVYQLTVFLDLADIHALARIKLTYERV